MDLSFFPEEKVGEGGKSPFPSSFFIFTAGHKTALCPVLSLSCPMLTGFYFPFENNMKIVSHCFLPKHFA